MSNYYFVDMSGKIQKKEYDKSTCINAEKALEFFESTIQPIHFKKIENTVSCYDFTTEDENYKQFFACIYQVTPGGRAIVSGTEESEKEFRIQIKAKDYNFIFSQKQNGNIALQIGVYYFYNVLIYIAWKPKLSTAGDETPISTQVSVEEIAQAVKYGLHQYKNKSGNFVCVFKKDLLPFYIKNSSWLHDESITNLSQHIFQTSNYNTPTQIIYYGVPGSGKSHKIDEKTKDLPDEQKMRVVFHPEYTNADFVGQILPVQTENGLEYPFKAGPFTRILKRALKNPDRPYYLIIEEINRGNAAAIFGDLFQLLDRGSDGWSSYSIENLDINAFIRSENERYSEKTPPTTKQIGNIEYTENTSIRLPPNLSLFATMNTSDQNVFTLDNAFQRRWKMELVENKFEGEVGKKQEKATITVNNQSITWKDFQETINAVIGEKSNEGGLSSMEDKRLGCWFIKANSGKIDAKDFADKVLKYLWDDAFKFYHQEMFKGGIKNFEELHKAFLKEGFSVFSDVCKLEEKLQSVESSAESSSTSIDSESSSE
ncbi:MAG TPA: hypothetical protein DC014_06125 [Treponema sp.]|nr:hypothetical protein [Treponema sp.]